MSSDAQTFCVLADSRQVAGAMTRDELRNIPSVQALAEILRRNGTTSSSEQAATLARLIQDRARHALVSDPSARLYDVLRRETGRITELISASRLRSALNATGIVVHTNLGRAPVSDDTARAMSEAAASNVALEIEPDSGRRGGRMAEIAGLLRLLTGAESTLVVNNNAAAVLLVLSALAAGKRVAVSRAEAVEIGGGFRIPDVLRQSGAELVEVGTTNRTYASDYAEADLGEGGVVLKVHSSNFDISGFVARPALAELRQVATAQGWLLVEDLGSGSLVDTSQFGLEHEPTVRESLEAGVDLVTFSGDKLLGGPQAGIIAGRADLVDRVARAPLARAVRADKVTLAGVAATLRHYIRGEALERIPTLRMLAVSLAELRSRAERLAGRLQGEGIDATPMETTNYAGGGSLPGQALPGVAVRLALPHGSIERVARSLRMDPITPVYGRIENDAILIELRTVAARDDDRLFDTLVRGVGTTPTSPQSASIR